MSNDGNVTIDREPCFEARNFLESDFPEIFLAGLGCILLNIIFFLSWVREIIKVVCVFLMVLVSILPHKEFGLNYHWKDTPHVYNL